MVLKYPYFRDVSEPDIYETATVHTVVGPMESQESDNAHNPIAVSTCELVVAIGNLFISQIASKSGFLTKLGGRRKVSILHVNVCVIGMASELEKTMVHCV